MSLAIVDKGYSSNVKSLHLNIRSCAKNSDAFVNYLSNITAKFNFIALTETWTKSFNEELVNCVGYNSVVKSRPDETRGGGVALLIKDSYQYAGGGVALLIKDSYQYTPLTIIDNSLFNTFEFL